MYVDVDYYVNNFYGVLDVSESLVRNLALAEIKIDELTFNRIHGIGFDRLTPFQQEKIKQAVCHQAEYIVENGYDTDEIQSYSVLDITVSVKQIQSAASKLGVCPQAYAQLAQTGLMRRGI